jgi:hypothetical protein
LIGKTFLFHRQGAGLPVDLGHVTMEFIGLVDFALKKESQPPTTRRRFQGNQSPRSPPPQ